MERFAAVILAAGMGTRMQSGVVKVLHPLCGEPMLGHIVRAVREAGAERVVVVVGHQGDLVRNLFAAEPGVTFAYQAEQKGTGHAVLQAESSLSGFAGPVLITYGDTPLYRQATLRAFVANHLDAGAAASVLTAHVDDPTGYGRVVRSSDGSFQRVVEHKDANADEAKIQEINTGTYCVQGDQLFAGLAALKPENAQGEYYLPDLLSQFVAAKRRVEAVQIEDPAEALGINDRVQLAEAEAILRARIRNDWMRRGVTMVDPASVWIDARAKIGQDTIIFPNTFVEGDTMVGARCRLGPCAQLYDANVGDAAVVENCTVVGESIPPGHRVGSNGGPSARVRADWMFTADPTSGGGER